MDAPVLKDTDLQLARKLTVAALVTWFTTASVTALLGRLDQGRRPPTVLLALFGLPVLGFHAAYRMSSRFRGFADSVPLSLLVGAHLTRFVGAGFLEGARRRRLPAAFGIAAGVGDAISALGALALLRRIRNRTITVKELVAWNIFGLADFAWAMTLGMLFSEGPTGLLRRRATASTRDLIRFPVSLIPTFFVPALGMLHGLTFKKIADARKRGLWAILPPEPFVPQFASPG